MARPASVVAILSLRRRREEAARGTLRRAEAEVEAARRACERARSRLAEQEDAIAAEARRQQGARMGRRRMADLQCDAARLGALRARYLSLGEVLTRCERHECARRGAADAAREAWRALRRRCDKLEAWQERQGRNEEAAMDGMHDE